MKRPSFHIAVTGDPPYVLDAFRHDGLFERAPGYLNLVAEEEGGGTPLMFNTAADAATYVRERVAWDALDAYRFRLLEARLVQGAKRVGEVRV